MMAENKTIIESVRDYILTCPYLDDLKKVNINFLSSDVDNCSIDEVPSQNGNGGIVATYLDGSTVREFMFILAIQFDYSEDLEVNISNSGFFEKFQKWIEDNNKSEIYPTLRDGLTPTDIEAMTTGYTFLVNPTWDKARCQIQLKLTYEEG